MILVTCLVKYMDSQKKVPYFLETLPACKARLHGSSFTEGLILKLEPCARRVLEAQPDQKAQSPHAAQEVPDLEIVRVYKGSLQGLHGQF